MRKFFLITIVIFTITFNPLSAQPFKLGFCSELASFNYTNQGSNISLIGGSANLTGSIFLNDNFNFEIKSGVIIVEKYFSGIQFSLFTQYVVTDWMYLGCGINIHNNFAYSEGSDIEIDAIEGTFFEPGISVGIIASEKVTFSLAYYFPLDKNRIINDEGYDSFTNKVKVYNGELNHSIRLGINIEIARL